MLACIELAEMLRADLPPSLRLCLRFYLLFFVRFAPFRGYSDLTFLTRPHLRKSAFICGWPLSSCLFASIRGSYWRPFAVRLCVRFCSRSASVICHLSCASLGFGYWLLAIGYSPEKQVGQQFPLWINGITAEIGHTCFSQNIFIDTETSGKAPRLAG
jgi:hypothetical protein